MQNMTPMFYFAFSFAILSGVFSYPMPGSSIVETQKKNVENRPQNVSHPDITQAVTFSPGYSSEYNVRQDPPPSEDELQKYRRRRETEAESESDAYEEEDDDDDSDMFMEPLELEETEVEPDKNIPPTSQLEEEPKTEPKTESKADSNEESIEESKEESKPVPESESVPEVPSADNQHMGQHFFPSFAPVFSLGHSRPHQLFHQEPFYSSKARVATTFGSDFTPFRPYRDNSYKVPLTFEDEALSTNILGSGNFGVLRGGTYYNEGDDYGNLFGPHYSNNGHGRPYYTPNPRPQKYINGDFFSNFRDFAEINTPAKASFSEYIVVYINKNSTKYDDYNQPILSHSITKPKNIFEQLILLDQREEESEEETKEPEEQKKISLHKKKLALLKQEKINKEKKYYKSRETGKDFIEPLLALS